MVSLYLSGSWRASPERNVRTSHADYSVRPRRSAHLAVAGRHGLRDDARERRGGRQRAVLPAAARHLAVVGGHRGDGHVLGEVEPLRQHLAGVERDEDGLPLKAHQALVLLLENPHLHGLAALRRGTTGPTEEVTHEGHCVPFYYL